MNQIHIEKFIHHRPTYEVNTIEIHKLLHKSNLKYIDVLSIDVEGGELQVLETMDWNIPVYLIVIELDNENHEKDEKCRNILTANGFEFVTRINNDDFFINKNYFRKRYLFDENIRFFGLNENNELDIKLIYNQNRFPYMDTNDYNRFFESLRLNLDNFSSYGKNKIQLINLNNHIKEIYNRTPIKLSQIGFCTYCDYAVHDRIGDVSFDINCIEQLENGNKIFLNCHLNSIDNYVDKIIKIISKKKY